MGFVNVLWGVVPFRIVLYASAFRYHVVGDVPLASGRNGCATIFATVMMKMMVMMRGPVNAINKEKRAVGGIRRSQRRRKCGTHGQQPEVER